MLHELADHVFHNEFRRRAPKPDDYVLCYRERSALLIAGKLATFMGSGASYEGARYLFEIDGRGYFLVPEIQGAEEFKIDGFRTFEPKHHGFAAITGSQLHRFYTDNRYCGRCRAEMGHSETERALICPECGNTVYPKISPAVIVGVTDGDRLLMTKYAGRGANARYALVAGFTEFGETLEQTVSREVLEEVGLKVGNIRYYHCQPWPFSDSLLAGFFCDCVGSSKVVLDENELCEGTWFVREDVPPQENCMSLTSTMIEAFRVGEYPR